MQADTVHFLELLNGRVAYRKLGNGPGRLLAFHGFAWDGAAFLPALSALPPEQYTCYLIDLPFHGQTQWNDPAFSRGDLIYIIQKLMSGHPYEGVGHSLGGRLWIRLLPELEHPPKRLHLLAPDGFGSMWGGLTEHAPTRLRIRTARWLKQPSGFLRFAGLLREWGVIDRFTLRYLQVQLATEATRRRLFSTWQSMLDFKLGAQRAQQILAGATFPVEVYLGKRDQVVPASRVADALEGLARVHLHRLDCGHWDIVQQWQPASGQP